MKYTFDTQNTLYDLDVNCLLLFINQPYKFVQFSLQHSLFMFPLYLWVLLVLYDLNGKLYIYSEPIKEDSLCGFYINYLLSHMSAFIMHLQFAIF